MISHDRVIPFGHRRIIAFGQLLGDFRGLSVLLRLDKPRHSLSALIHKFSEIIFILDECIYFKWQFSSLFKERQTVWAACCSLSAQPGEVARERITNSPRILWTLRGSNPWPLHCKCSALANWAKGPCHCFFSTIGWGILLSTPPRRRSKREYQFSVFPNREAYYSEQTKNLQLHQDESDTFLKNLKT